MLCELQKFNETPFGGGPHTALRLDFQSFSVASPVTFVIFRPG